MQDKHGAECDGIRPHLKEIDEKFDITFDFDAEEYIVNHGDSIFERVPWGGIDRAWIARVRRVAWLNKTGKVLEEVERSEAAFEASQDRATTRMAEAMADDIRRPLVNNLLYGA